MPALQRAIALADVEHRAVLVGENLQLDVLGIFEITLGVERAVLEVRLRFALRGRECGIDLGERLRDLQPFAAAAAGGFERERQSVALCRFARVRDALDRFGAARYERHLRRLHRAARAQLIAHRVDRIGMRADPAEPGFDDAACEGRVLGEESVAGMNGIGPALMRDLEDAIDVEVTLRRSRGSEHVRLVGHANVKRLACRAHDANRDLAAIRD